MQKDLNSVDWNKVFSLLNQMEQCVARVRELRLKWEKSL